jgi:glucose-6-phosphate dehydrogenase assembly protein OpcA
MATEIKEGTVSRSAAKGVEVDRIERELASMWSDAGDADADASSAGVTRACMLNLVVYTTPADDRDRLDDVLDEVNETHPGRTLVLVANREAATPGLDAYVSMRCRVLGGTGKQICGEQVTIDAAGPLVETASTAVAPLLVPDVPVYLWWKDIPHDEDPLFDRLSRMADRVVIDAAAFDHPCADLLRLAAMIGEQAPRLRVSDITWGRLTVWRTVLASFWDVPDYRPLLEGIERVTITYRPPAAAPGEVAPKALLIAGWLASRLGWDVERGRLSAGGEVADCQLRAQARAVVMRFERDNTGAGNDGRLVSVALSCGAGAATFSVALRDNDTRLVTEARVGSTRSLGRVLPYEVRGDGEYLGRELAILRRDTIYEAAVARASQLVG